MAVRSKIIPLSALFLVCLLPDVVAKYRRVCYYTNWSQYRQQPAKFFPENIDPFLCTHICYAFATIEKNLLAPNEWNDDSELWMVGMFERFNNLKRKNTELKTLLSVGGWNMGSAPFVKMVASATIRKEFIAKAIIFLRKRNFDGLDLDWEYPAHRGSPASDKDRFSALVKETREAFDEEARTTGNTRLLLKLAVPAGKAYIDAGYDASVISKYVDSITIMSYDMHGAWESFTGHNSPLHARKDEPAEQKNFNMEWAVNYWISKGAPKEKLNVGLSMYGRGFTLADSFKNKIGSATKGASNKGKFTKVAGFLAYYEICKIIQTGGKIHWIPEQKVPYIVKGDQWIGYDDIKSLNFKVDWIKSKGFGGVTIWALPLDDFSNQCGAGRYPLLNAVVRRLEGGKFTLPPGYTTLSAPLTTDLPTLESRKQDKLCQGQSDGSYPHPSSCFKYVVCSDSTAFVDTCRPGTMWNAKYKYCDDDPYMQCIKGGIIYTLPPKISSPTYPTRHATVTGITGVIKPTVDPNQICQRKADGFYKDPLSCFWYYQCVSSLAFHQPCPPGTAFNPQINTCDFIKNVPGC